MERDWSGKQSGEGRKLSERERSSRQSCGAVSRHARKPWSGSGARSGRVMERERSSKRTKLAAQISLKGDASLLKLPESILPNIKSKLSTGILMPISDRR